MVTLEILAALSIMDLASQGHLRPRTGMCASVLLILNAATCIAHLIDTYLSGM